MMIQSLDPMHLSIKPTERIYEGRVPSGWMISAMEQQQPNILLPWWERQVVQVDCFYSYDKLFVGSAYFGRNIKGIPPPWKRRYFSGPTRPQQNTLRVNTRMH